MKKGWELLLLRLRIKKLKIIEFTCSVGFLKDKHLGEVV